MRRFSLVLLFLLASGTSGAATGDVTLVAVPTNPAFGAPFDVEVYVDTGALQLGSYQLVVAWNPAKVSYLGLGCGTSAMGCPLAVNPLASSVVFNDVSVTGVGPGAALHLATVNFMAAIDCTGDPGVTGTIQVLSTPAGLPIGAATPRPMIPPVLSCPPVIPTGLCGDCDNSGDTDILDALVAARAGAGLAVIDPLLVGQCDVSPVRGDITSLDALLIAQFVVGLITISCV